MKKILLDDKYTTKVKGLIADLYIMEIVTLIASDNNIFVFMKDNLIIFKYLIDNNTLMKFIPDVIDNYCVINKSDLNNYHSLLDEFEFNLSNFKIK